jgi:enamine deaminase RidA (YjgF/YER057c/UK114 family)
MAGKMSLRSRIYVRPERAPKRRGFLRSRQPWASPHRTFTSQSARRLANLRPACNSGGSHEAQDHQVRGAAAPGALQRRRAGRPWVFPAGQIASDYKTGVAPAVRRNPGFPYYGSDIKLQTRYVLENLRKTLAAAGSSFEHVVKAQVFLTDLKNFNGFDEVWREYFPVPPPRTTIGTTALLVPGRLVEIDLIGYAPGQGVAHRVSTSAAPKQLANYSEAFVVGDLIFSAGQLASDFKSGVAAEAKLSPGFPYYGSEIKKQTAATPRFRRRCSLDETTPISTGAIAANGFRFRVPMAICCVSDKTLHSGLGPWPALYRRKRDFEAASAFVLFKRSVAFLRRCIRSPISSSGPLRVFQRRHCS